MTTEYSPLVSESDNAKHEARYTAWLQAKIAKALKAMLETVVLPLADHPYLYCVPGLREIVAHPNYLVLYRIEVVAIVHSRREFPADS